MLKEEVLLVPSPGREMGINREDSNKIKCNFF